MEFLSSVSYLFKALCTCGVAFVTGWFAHWVYRWMNPQCDGKLPPGSMGLPLVGETFRFFRASASIDMPSYYKERLKRYGPIFKTSLVGQPLVISLDPEVNRFVFQQEGKLFRSWYPETTNTIFGKKSLTTYSGAVNKFVRSFASKLFGPTNLKESLLPELESAVRESFATWVMNPSIEVKDGISNMIFDLVAKKLIGFNPTKSRELRKNFQEFFQGMVSFPIYFPGTSFYRCMQEEHTTILNKRGSLNSGFTWEEYKSLMFTSQVVHEITRISNVAPGIFRKTLADVKVKGYTIPAGWLVMISPMAVDLNPTLFEDPLEFNPWRWTDKTKQSELLRNYMPFGGGIRLCLGAEFSKLFIALFIHVLVTEYRWKEIKGGDVLRISEVIFPQGYHIQLIPHT
ncbi:cytochrome P450 87A3-like isoform X2 [Oryza sativa Japonica Group]|uniref:cytochrome P450 87A3-like isoform X2 n=1 Tax=Oryza sativa subsp. japonica TaxID=39947 RepID=UPI00264232E2